MKKKLLALILTLAMLLPLIPAADVFAEGEETYFDPALTLTATSLSLENNIAVNFLISAAVKNTPDKEYQSFRVTFSFMGHEIVDNAFVGKNGYYYFTFRGIQSTKLTAVAPEDEIPLTAALMGEPITATLSAYSRTNEERFYGSPVTESVLSYCQRAMATPETYTYDTMPALIVDLLTYGAESQKYFGRDADNPVTDALGPADLEYGTDTVPVPVSQRKISGSLGTNAAVIWEGAGLKLEDEVKLQFVFATKGMDVSEIYFKLLDEGGKPVVSLSGENVEAYDGVYRLSCDTVTPDRMTDKLYVTAYNKSGDPVSDTLCYSVESYAAEAMARYKDAGLDALLCAILNYGASARAYVNEITNERKVQNPTQMPDYSFDHTPTTDELRAMAVKAMQDTLSVQWYCEEDFSYTINNGQEFNIHASETYAGIPYVNYGSGLLHWLQYYNTRTGKMTNVDSDINNKLGSTCAKTVTWAWSSVCTSISFHATYRMVPCRGCLPVGDYTMPEILYEDGHDYKDYTTDRIIADNGNDAIYEAYAQTLPADGLISYVDSTSAHARMVLEAPTVVRYSNGTINPTSSYLYILDQHKGHRVTTWSIVKENGQTLHYAGHTQQKVTFKELLDAGYIPVTTAEFTGKTDYVAPNAYATYTGSITKLSDLRNVTVRSRYCPIAVDVVIRDGDKLIDRCKTVVKPQTPDTSYLYKLTEANLTLPSHFEDRAEEGKTYTLTVDVLLASGSTHTVLTKEITK